MAEWPGPGADREVGLAEAGAPGCDAHGRKPSPACGNQQAVAAARAARAWGRSRCNGGRDGVGEGGVGAGRRPLPVSRRLGGAGANSRAMEPSQLLYWGTMSLGVLAGFFAAYPVNVWLVAKGLKHGMMRTQAEPERADGGGEPAADRATRAAHGQGAMSHAGEH